MNMQADIERFKAVKGDDTNPICRHLIIVANETDQRVGARQKHLLIFSRETYDEAS